MSKKWSIVQDCANGPGPSTMTKGKVKYFKGAAQRSLAKMQLSW